MYVIYANRKTVERSDSIMPVICFWCRDCMLLES